MMLGCGGSSNTFFQFCDEVTAISLVLVEANCCILALYRLADRGPERPR